ncbi:MAG: porin family protein, partial [Chitinophagaceae bacterium]|jgi:opacity protein-like surface antigen|nr:porin family protein [Chitinophagaceae bacterium]
VGGFIDFDATENVSVRAQVAYTKLSGESSTVAPGFVMRLFESDVLGEYNFLSLYNGKYSFTPYLTAGVGLTGNLNLDSTSVQNYGTSVVVPLGVGGKFLLNKNVQLRVEYQHRLPIGISSNSSNGKFGSYGLVQIGVSIRMSALLTPGRYE